MQTLAGQAPRVLVSRTLITHIAHLLRPQLEARPEPQRS